MCDFQGPHVTLGITIIINFSLFFFCRFQPVVSEGNMTILYIRRKLYRWCRFFSQPLNYNLFDGYITQFPFFIFGKFFFLFLWFLRKKLITNAFSLNMSDILVQLSLLSCITFCRNLLVNIQPSMTICLVSYPIIIT